MFAGEGRGLLYVRVAGGCMEPVVAEGQILGVDTERQPRDGDIVVARRGTEMLVKYLKHCGSLRWLVPAVTGHPVIVLHPPVELVGVVSLVAREL